MQPQQQQQQHSQSTTAIQRAPVSLSVIEFLHHELLSYLLRHHDDGRFSAEEMFSKLDTAGFNVGRRFAERMALRGGPDVKRPVEILDVMKWVCRDFWIELYQKSIDKLQTNNKDKFVLQDFNYRWMRYMFPGGEEARHAAKKYLVFPCALIRGALAACDVDAIVNAEFSQAPKVLFHIKLTGVN